MCTEDAVGSLRVSNLREFASMTLVVLGHTVLSLDCLESVLYLRWVFLRIFQIRVDMTRAVTRLFVVVACGSFFDCLLDAVCFLVACFAVVVFFKRYFFVFFYYYYLFALCFLFCLFWNYDSFIKMCNYVIILFYDVMLMYSSHDSVCQQQLQAATRPAPVRWASPTSTPMVRPTQMTGSADGSLGVGVDCHICLFALFYKWCNCMR